ncbi:hypothetical protein TAO_0433 [Candidatus Nitrosoglobus terrae]|uniref:Uncharacterized protein n=1 Tax=Candidatus Nitrosoglobus terrae TaxID=1630141 RepID=A0A1Q2SL19_9GAMM|nr:hypothetical protein [Candidatus Nitrosoglobus terrae]BAW79803.1 hypothetical protein TAO_0433 [Candidatus Nitrosoglobus terrae]
MKTITPKVLTLVVLLFTLLLQAQTTTPPPPTFPSTIPENGLWWSRQDSGTSYSITIQNSLLFMVENTYDENGNPTWFTGSVQIPVFSSESDGSNPLTIDLMESTGGSCSGCSHKAPQTRNSGKQIILSFSDPSHGQLTTDDKQAPIELFNFNYGQGIARLESAWEINYQLASTLIEGFNKIGTNFSPISFDSSGNLIGGSDTVIGEVSSSIYLIHQTADPDMYLITTQPGFSSNQCRVGIYILTGLNALIGVYTLANAADNPQGIANQLTLIAKESFTSPDPSQVLISTAFRSSNVISKLILGPLNISLADLASKIDPFLDSATLANIKSLLLSLINQNDL